jgi:ribosome-binding protein aMBF1 (putative translation factor)
MAKTNDAIEILAAMTQGDDDMESMIQESRLNAEIAQMIYDARTAASLTQKQLADRIGTQSGFPVSKMRTMRGILYRCCDRSHRR